MWSLALFLMVQVQDAGVVDAGPDDADAGVDACAPACVGNAVTFCDDDAVVTLDCDVVEGSTGCTTISAEWGDDCVLGAGAPCDPGYAFGASRCDPRAGLACIDGACAVGTPEGEPPLEPTPGTNVVDTSDVTTTSPFGCAAFGGSSAGLFALALSLRSRRLVGRVLVPRRQKEP